MKYTYRDVITNPRDPRLEGAIGKQVAYANNVRMTVINANRGDFTALNFINKDKYYPNCNLFFVLNSSYDCIIIKKDQTGKLEEKELTDDKNERH